MDNQQSEDASGATPHCWGILKAFTLTLGCSFVQIEKLLLTTMIKISMT